MSKNILPLYPSGEHTLVKSEGCFVYDSEGKKYLDLEAGVWCTNLGHSHPRILQAINKQSKENIHQGYMFRNKPAEDLSEKLLALFGFQDGASLFLSSGSEAVNLAITIAQKVSSRRKVLKISNTYLSAFGYGKIDPENNFLENISFNDMEDLQNVDFRNYAAIVLETGGASIDIVQFPDQEFIESLATEAKKQGCLIIAEEVTTGMGRTGKWFGYQHYSIQPDIIALGKALGNGYPISGICVNSEVLKNVEQNPFVYAQSHQNDPLGCSVALEVIQTMIDENLIAKSEQNGAYFLDCLEKLRLEFPHQIAEVRGRGLMLAIEFHPSYDTFQLQKKLFEDGYVFTCKKNCFRLLPPLILPKAQIDDFVMQLKKRINS